MVSNCRINPTTSYYTFCCILSQKCSSFFKNIITYIVCCFTCFIHYSFNPKLSGRAGGRGNFTVKVVTLELCSIQQHLIRDIRAKFGISNLSRFPDIRQNSVGGISNFRISGQSLIKENCHNSRTRDDIDMKLGPVTKPNKRNETTSKNLAIKSYRHIITLLFFPDLWPIWSNREARFQTHCL